MEKYILYPQGSAGVGRMWIRPARVASARPPGGRGDGTLVAGEGNGAASRMADAGNCGGDGGVVNVYER